MIHPTPSNKPSSWPQSLYHESQNALSPFLKALAMRPHQCVDWSFLFSFRQFIQALSSCYVLSVFPLKYIHVNDCFSHPTCQVQRHTTALKQLEAKLCLRSKGSWLPTGSKGLRFRYRAWEGRKPPFYTPAVEAIFKGRFCDLCCQTYHLLKRAEQLKVIALKNNLQFTAVACSSITKTGKPRLNIPPQKISNKTHLPCNHLVMIWNWSLSRSFSSWWKPTSAQQSNSM